MDGTFWLAVGQVSLAIIGYFSLRYKASIDNVTMLEGKIASQGIRIASLEKDVLECHESHILLSDEKVTSAAELAEMKILLAAKHAELAVIERASQEKENLIGSGHDLGENTKVTKEIALAVQGLVQDVANVARQADGLTTALVNKAVEAERGRGEAEAVSVAQTVDLARQEAKQESDSAIAKARKILPPEPFH